MMMMMMIIESNFLFIYFLKQSPNVYVVYINLYIVIS
jgi:hypothetical protein